MKSKVRITLIAVLPILAALTGAAVAALQYGIF